MVMEHEMHPPEVVSAMETLLGWTTRGHPDARHGVECHGMITGMGEALIVVALGSWAPPLRQMLEAITALDRLGLNGPSLMAVIAEAMQHIADGGEAPESFTVMFKAAP